LIETCQISWIIWDWIQSANGTDCNSNDRPFSVEAEFSRFYWILTYDLIKIRQLLLRHPVKQGVTILKKWYIGKYYATNIESRVLLAVDRSWTPQWVSRQRWGVGFDTPLQHEGQHESCLDTLGARNILVGICAISSPKIFWKYWFCFAIRIGSLWPLEPHVYIHHLYGDHIANGISFGQPGCVCNHSLRPHGLR
jgi:hypothetical protein